MSRAAGSSGSPAPGCLRFRGRPENPNHAAVAHLLRVYAAHLGLGLREVASGPADIEWGDAPGDTTGAGSGETAVVEAGERFPRIRVPARAGTEPDMDVVRSQDGYPAPRSAPPGPAGDFAPRPQGADLVADWDVLSFCADILFRRADFLPERARAAEEAIGRGQWDERAGLLEAPWVDRWMFRLLAHLDPAEGRDGRDGPRARIADLPGRASVWLTHDLDNLAKWRPRSVAGQILRTPWQLLSGRAGKARRAWREIGHRVFTGKDPFDVMDAVLAMERKHGRRSANFFLANGRDHLFHRYDLEKARFRRVLEACRDAGMDVGLHGQVHFIRDAAGIRAEKAKLDRLAGGETRLNRQHYLRWDAATTFPSLSAAGIEVDSTLGYNDSPGYRCGTAHPFPWFDCASGRALPLLIVPLILGEFQFYNPADFDAQSVREVLHRHLETSTSQGGVFTVLFHNEYFHEAQNPGHAKVYADLLAGIGERGLPDFQPLETRRRMLELHG